MKRGEDRLLALCLGGGFIGGALALFLMDAPAWVFAVSAVWMLALHALTWGAGNN